MTGALEDRRVQAKELLLEINDTLGREKMAEVIDAIKLHHEDSMSELKPVLLDVLDGYPEFQKRLLDYLPERFRT